MVSTLEYDAKYPGLNSGENPTIFRSVLYLFSFASCLKAPAEIVTMQLNAALKSLYSVNHNRGFHSSSVSIIRLLEIFQDCGSKQFKSLVMILNIIVN